MITRFITEITTRFNPFSPASKAARLFLTRLPPGTRASGVSITTQLLPRSSTEKSSVVVKFSMFFSLSPFSISESREINIRYTR